MDPETLLSHKDFIHDLARQLVAHEVDADDVEQQTWIAALEQDRDAVRSTRGWLASCARNLARRRHRDASRRERRERIAAADVAVPSIESVRALEAVRRSVVEAVLALDDPYRTCLLMRYFSNLPPREIARRLDVPLNTVKSRLKRGLQQLRGRLDLDHGGDRTAWCAAILPFAKTKATPCAGGSFTWLPGALSGVLVMKSALVVGSAAALLVATWVLLSRPHPSDAKPHQAEDVTTSAPRAPIDPQSSPVADTLRAAVETPRPDAADHPNATREPEAPAGTQPLTGVVLLPDGAPAPGATVAVVRDETDTFQSYLAGDQPRRHVLFEEETGDDGRFSFPLIPGSPVRLTAEKDGFPTRELLSHFAGSEVTIQLQRGSTIYGRITREYDGLPVADCGIRAFRVGQGVTLFEGKTDAAGEYCFSGVDSGDFVIDLTPAGAVSPGWTEIHLDEGAVVERDFVLLAGATLRGTITDALTGAPIEGAVIGESWTLRRRVTSGSDGRYEFEGFGSPGTGDVVFEADGYARLRMTSPLLDSVDTEFTLDAALHPARSAQGQVVDTDGQPLQGALVTAYSSDGTSERIVGESDEDGRFSLRGLSPTARHAIYVRHADTAAMVYDFPVDEFENDPVDLGQLTIPSPIRIRGVVVDEFDRPIPNARINLEIDYAARGALSRRDTPWFFDAQGTRRRAISDSKGRFLFEQLAPGHCSVRAQGPGMSLSPSQSVETMSGGPPEDLRLVITIGHSIRGVVKTPDGEATSMATVMTYDEAGVLRGMDANLPEDGSFHIAGLAPGVYRMEVTPNRWLNDDASNPYFTPTSLAGVLADTSDVKLVLGRGAAIAGRVVGEDGEAVGHARVCAMDPEGRTVDETQASESGLFEVVVHPDEIYLLRATTDDDDPVFVAEENARAGTRNVVLRPRS